MKENCINGLIKDRPLSNHVDYSRLNGDSGKRVAEDAPCDSTPAKKPALEAVVTNGFANGNGTAMAQPQLMQQQQQQQMNGNVKLGGQVVQVVSRGVGGTAQMVHHHHPGGVPVQMVQTGGGGGMTAGQVVQVMTTTGGQMVHSGGGQMVQVTTGTASAGGQQLLVSSTGTTFEVQLVVYDISCRDPDSD